MIASKQEPTHLLSLVDEPPAELPELHEALIRDLYELILRAGRLDAPGQTRTLESRLLGITVTASVNRRFPSLVVAGPRDSSTDRGVWIIDLQGEGPGALVWDKRVTIDQILDFLCTAH